MLGHRSRVPACLRADGSCGILGLSRWTRVAQGLCPARWTSPPSLQPAALPTPTRTALPFAPCASTSKGGSAVRPLDRSATGPRHATRRAGGRRCSRRPWYAAGPSATGDERDDYVGRIAVEVLAAAVVDRRGAAGRRVERRSGHRGAARWRRGRHDGRGPEHVWVDGAESGSPADGADPPVGGAPVEPLSVLAAGSGPRSVRRWRGRSCAPFGGRAGWWPACSPCPGSEGRGDRDQSRSRRC